LLLAAVGLELAELGVGAVELSFDGRGVAEDAIEAFGVGVVGGEQVVAVEQTVGFDGAGAPETPHAVGNVGDELGFELAFGFEFGDEGLVHAVEVGLIFAWEDDLGGSEPVFEGVAAGASFAEDGARSGRVGGVALVAQDDLVEFAVELFERGGHLVSP
jgi:hypothetical protein